jgi:hypothetical protein
MVHLERYVVTIRICIAAALYRSSSQGGRIIAYFFGVPRTPQEIQIGCRVSSAAG